MKMFDMLEEFDEALDWGALDDPLLADHLPSGSGAASAPNGWATAGATAVADPA